jgi:beta-phosphoglucomutase-like phosphatase (HAD superfamily)
VKLKALIFDVDGTLADTEEVHRRAFNQAFERHGLGWNWSRSRYRHLLLTTGGKERLAAYVDSLPLRADEHRDLRQRIAGIHQTKTDIYASLIDAGALGLRDGVLGLIDEAERAGVRLAIASTTTLANIEALLGAALGRRSTRRFAVIGAGDQVRRKKPAPEIYDWVLKELGLPFEECAAIEDSAAGLAAAKAARLFTVVTPTAWTDGENFSAADLVLPSLQTLGIQELDERLNGCREAQAQTGE